MATRGLILVACLCFLGVAFAQAPTGAPLDVSPTASNTTSNETVVIRYNWNLIPEFIDICNATRCPPFRSPMRTQAVVTPWYARSYPSGIQLPTFLVFGGRGKNNTNYAYDDFWSFYVDPTDDLGVYRDVNQATVSTLYTLDQNLFGVQHAAGALYSVSSGGYRDERAVFIGGTIETNLTNILAAYDYAMTFAVTKPGGGVEIKPNRFQSGYGAIFRGTAVGAGDAVYYFGGFINVAGVGVVLNNTLRVFRGTPDGLSGINETILAPASGWPSPRFDHAAIVYNKTKMYVFGGSNIANVFNDTWVYDTVDRTWTELFPRVERAVNDTSSGPITIPGRAGHKLVSVFDKYTNTSKILCLGGYGNPSFSDMNVWEYEPDNNVWRPLNATGPMPPARRYFNVLPVSDHQFIMFGGENSTDVLGDIYHFNYWSRDAYPVAPVPPPAEVPVATAPFIRYPINPRSENNWVAIGAAVLLVALIIVVVILKVIERRV
eukprot:TRINITY_DN6793_c0_g1_i1.p1 TRINITY_DN6793_c0_g1~~TRINITY_DN6793_c0_g1_i1.p1  ORF type:complete len:490 (+),score=92.33 TRINITY_DN6793_c0_g1_i1:168-1637(+)